MYVASHMHAWQQHFVTTAAQRSCRVCRCSQFWLCKSCNQLCRSRSCLPHTVWPPVPGMLPTCAEAQSLLNATPFHFNLKGLVCLCICRLELHMEDGSVAQVTGYYNNLEVICSNTLGQSVTMACKPEGTRVVCEPSEPHTCEAVTTYKASICSAH